MSDFPLDPWHNRPDGEPPLAEPQELAFADVAPDGTLRYVSPFGRSRWGWAEDDVVPDEMLFMLAELAPGASGELPLMQGGLYVNAIRREETDGWIVVGYERRPSIGGPETDPLDTLVEHMPVAALRMQTDGTVVFANPETVRMTGYPLDEIVGFRFWSRVIVDDDAHALEDALQLVTERRRTRARFAYRTAPGRIQHVDMHLFLTEAYFVEAVVLDRPIDSEDALLLHAKRDAEQASRQKTAFIAMLSHEIRTPLGAIRGYAELLSRELADVGSAVPATVREFVDAIDDRTRRLVQLVQDLLELSALEMGHVSVERVAVPLHPLVREAVGRQLPAAEEKGITMGLELPGHPCVLTDERRLRQVLDGLLSNAVKFTSDGSVTVRSRASENAVVLEIEDTGVGISDEFMQTLFSPFRQEEDWLNRSHDGVGLGLTLVKRILDLVGGRIEVESRKSAGSLFRVHLPAARS